MAGILKIPLNDAPQSTSNGVAGAQPDDSQLALFRDPKQGPLPEEAVPHLVIQLQDDLARCSRSYGARVRAGKG